MSELNFVFNRLLPSHISVLPSLPLIWWHQLSLGLKDQVCGMFPPWKAFPKGRLSRPRVLTVKQNGDATPSPAFYVCFQPIAWWLPGPLPAPHLDSGLRERLEPSGRRGASCTAPLLARSGRGPRAWRWRSLRRDTRSALPRGSQEQPRNEISSLA